MLTEDDIEYDEYFVMPPKEEWTATLTDLRRVGDPVNSRKLSDLETIALLERTGAHWEITHCLIEPRYRKSLGLPERYWRVSLMIDLDHAGHDTIFPHGYSNRSMGRAAIRCVIKAMRELAEREAGKQ